ncbi:hypothetical protein FSP39_024254 [Pinctada imbricata]|uniref:CBM21 domain-containing protein n=1 Tax=Pinctada imbricata TaxID=66713 RepID=A0AA88Y684_PINIB|nr:hypothetical protein FSP39_024254 [Pinctada imbricata]
MIARYKIQHIHLPGDLSAYGYDVIYSETGEYSNLFPVTRGFSMLKCLSPSSLYQNRMPVDYHTYLLSSSPTASSFELLSHHFPTQSHSNNHVRPLYSDRDHVFHFKSTSNELDEIRMNLRVNTDIASLKPIISRRDSTEDEEGSSVSESSSGRTSPSTSNPPLSPNRTKKKVSFADHKGLALATVKVMTEPSDVPPRLKPEIISSITQGACAGVTSQPPLTLNFKQPASDYLAFRENLDRNNVSLENVIIRDYNLLGTIKVKNISFEKRVLIRMTIDSWETHKNVEAVYVSGQGSVCDTFDTFSFEFSVPPDFDSSKKMEFAVCFETNNKQFWDNNNGVNYQITCADFKSHSDQEHVSPLTDISSLRNVPSWTEFATWKKVDTSLPYW